MDRDGAPTVGERLEWLFTLFKAPAEPAGWRKYTDAEVAAALEEGGATSSVTTIAAARRGEFEEDGGGVADGIAGFFGAPPELLADDPALATPARDQVLARALERVEVRSYRVCRTVRRPLDWEPRSDPGGTLPFLRWGEVNPSRPAQRPGSRVRQQSRPTLSEDADGSERPAIPGGGPPLDGQMTEDELGALCRSWVTDLGLQPPLTPHALSARWAERRRRQITLSAADLGATTSVGHLIVQPNVDRIFFEQSAPSGQQAHVIYHELVHLLRGHLDGEVVLSCGTQDAPLGAGDGLAAGLYTSWQEWEAEVGATVLSEMSQQRRRPNRLPDASAGPDQGLAGAFGLVPGGWT